MKMPAWYHKLRLCLYELRKDMNLPIEIVRLKSRGYEIIEHDFYTFLARPLPAVEKSTWTSAEIEQMLIESDQYAEVDEEENRVPDSILTRESFQRMKEQVKRRDKSLCRYCGGKIQKGHVDHILPLSRGGSDDLSNLVWTCKACNLSKGNKTLVEWQLTA